MLYLADVIAIYMIVVDVNTTKADVIAYCVVLFYWLMLLPISGRCYGHFLCNVVADVIAQWQMLWPL